MASSPAFINFIFRVLPDVSNDVPQGEEISLGNSIFDSSAVNFCDHEVEFARFLMSSFLTGSIQLITFLILFRR